MDSFSVISLTSHCSNISHIAISASVELSSLTQHRAPGTAEGDLSARILSFSDALEQYGHTASELERALERRGIVICPTLQTVLLKWLGEAQAAVASLNKQLSRLQPENVLALDWEYLVLQRDVLVAYTQLFVYFEELLGLEEMETQESIWDGPDARRIVEQVEQISRRAGKLPPDILPQHREPVNVAVSNGPIAVDSEELPPPYEEASPTPNQHTFQPQTSNFQAAAASSSSDTTTTPGAGFNPLDFSTLDLSNIRHGFRALTSRFAWFRPDPLAGPLCEAARRGDVHQIAGLLSQEGGGANVDGRNEEGHTPLSCAIERDHVDAARLLISAGADMHHGGGGGSGVWSRWPPLFAAAYAGSLGVAALLVEKGAFATEKSMSGQPYFYDLVNSCASADESGGASCEGIEFLLQRRSSYAQASSLSGRRVIIAAARKGRIDVMKLLLYYGANAKTSDYTGNSLLTIAMDQPNSLEMARLILKHGGDPNSSSTTGDSALSGAVSRRNVPLAKLLLEAGAKATAKDYTGQPIIINAVKDVKISDEEKTQMVRLLLEHGASPKVKDLSWDTSVLHHAMDRANPEVIDLLLLHGADASGKRKGEPLIVNAIQAGRMDLVQSFLRHGANPNVVDSKGASPILIALIQRNLELVRLLRQYNADVDAAAQELARVLGRADLFEILGMTIMIPERDFPMSPPAGSPGFESGYGMALPPGYDQLKR